MPRRKKNARLTELEALIMDCLWEQHPATVRDVQERLKPVKKMAYNTVLTMMRILRDKGFLGSERKGRADAYSPLVSREEMGKRTLKRVLHLFFSGSAQALVSELLDSEALDIAEIEAIRREIDRKRQEESRSGRNAP